ncbi:SGNH/GDSL hydrolase family protein [Paenibacillus arenilitoris]|uniref:SGNH/GDSL hydrolase family protein n=1 Tax=Paenibacillus arenilitoris TaxID=2772299 RepID=A0A927H3R5_9BACL|nr:SGNH/GDSL hydrolase family protein [Paenibacillus arenilitoris]MBD2867140.1 SGNH/GDSL hydrolase family protein [Paenibacillus arenilitoris]
MDRRRYAIWEGKTWGTLGDSITAAGGYQPLVGEALGFARIYNLGRSGCPMAAGTDRDDGATVNVGAAMEERPDCVTIFAGVNDFRLGIPIGGVGGKDVRTFAGAYAALIERLLAANPSCRINLWTPLQRDKDGYDIHYVNDAGHRLIDYAETVLQIGRLYALPVLDLYAESGINRLTLPVYTTDGVHPNEAGHLRIAGMAIPFLERIGQ